MSTGLKWKKEELTEWTDDKSYDYAISRVKLHLGTTERCWGQHWGKGQHNILCVRLCISSPSFSAKCICTEEFSSHFQTRMQLLSQNSVTWLADSEAQLYIPSLLPQLENGVMSVPRESLWSSEFIIAFSRQLQIPFNRNEIKTEKTTAFLWDYIYHWMFDSFRVINTV